MIEINNKTRSKIDLKLVEKVTGKFLKYYRKTDEGVSVAFVGDRMIQKLNKKYRGVDRITDILAFPGDEDSFGELVIDYAQIRRQALTYSGSIKKELIFILVHGLLHLLGHEDKTEKGKKEMEELCNIFINKKIR